MKNRGKIRVVIKQGTSRDPTHEFYPFWMVEIEGPDGKTTDVAPSYPDLKQVLLDILTHELIVDRLYGRKPEFTKYRKWLKDLLQEDLISLAQTRLSHFSDIPLVYTKFVGFHYKEYFKGGVLNPTPKEENA